MLMRYGVGILRCIEMWRCGVKCRMLCSSAHVTASWPPPAHPDFTSSGCHNPHVHLVSGLWSGGNI